MERIWLMVIFLVNLVNLISSRPDGAPIEACINMIPNHQGIQPLTIPAPFGISVEKTTVSPGETITVTLGVIGRKYRYFKGFLLLAVTPDNFLNKIGSFETRTEKFVACGSNPYSAVTHSSASTKSNVEIQWTAPVDFQGTIVFVATFVENFANFWVGQQSQEVTVSSTSVSRQNYVENGFKSLSTIDHLAFGDSDSKDINNALYLPASTQIPPTIKPLSSKNIYDGCDSVKGCYGEPAGCISTWNCFTLVTFRRQNDNFLFELMGPLGGWIALGLSKDRQMGDDAVVECVQGSDGLVSVYSSFNKGHSNKRINLIQSGITQTQGSSVDGQIFCTFTHKTNVKIEGRKFDLRKDPHYLFLARGQIEQGTVDNLHQHISIPYRSQHAVNLNLVENVSSSKNTLIYVHGCLMVIAWVGTVSVAVFMARFYKYTWVQTTHFGEQIWFTWHRILNCMTIALTLTSFIIIFIYVGGWSSVWRVNSHPVLGVVTVILMMVQPISAIFRPAPGTPKRPIFNWIHFLTGNTAKVLSLATLFLAEKLQKANLLSSFSGVLITYVVFEVCCYLIMEIYSCIKAHSGREQIPLKDMPPPQTTNLEPTSQKNPDAPGSSFRKLFFCIHVIGIIALTLTLVIIIASSSERVMEY